MHSQAPTPTLTLTVPVYNEQDNLPELQTQIAAAMDALGKPWEVIYVDDGSADASWRVLCELQAVRPGAIRLVRLRRNFGQSAALAAGFDHARGQVIITLDADLQNDPADIARLLAKLDEGYDVVSGWRAARQDDYLSRKLPSRMANALISRITGVNLHDYGCTLKAYRREIVDDISLYGELHRFLPALAGWVGARIAELPVNHRPRTRGVSKYGIGRTQRVVLDLITVRFLMAYSTRPMQIFGKWGLALLAVALLAGLTALTQKLLPPHLSLNRNGWFFLAIFFGLGGLQFIGLGLLGEISIRTYYESHGRHVYRVAERVGADSPDS